MIGFIAHKLQLWAELDQNAFEMDFLNESEIEK